MSLPESAWKTINEHTNTINDTSRMVVAEARVSAASYQMCQTYSNVSLQTISNLVIYDPTAYRLAEAFDREEYTHVQLGKMEA